MITFRDLPPLFLVMSVVGSRIQVNKYSSTVLTDFGTAELDMSDPATLTSFIEFCQDNFPADHTVLTLWNHGGGVYPKSAPAKGICWDDTTSGGIPGTWACLTTDEVATALQAAFIHSGQKIPVINLDVCLTQMIEMAYEWRDCTDYLVCSEASVPGNGNNYSAVLSTLAANPGMTARQFASMLVDEYQAFYNLVGGDTTYSAIDLGTPFTDGLMPAFQTFATALADNFDAVKSGFATAWRHTTGFDYPENKDLGNLADEIAAHAGNTTVADAAASLKVALASVVVNAKATGMYVSRYPTCGLAVFLPPPATWPSYNAVPTEQYKSLLLSADSDWDNFIELFYAYTSDAGFAVDSMQAEIEWLSGNLDIGVREPNGDYFWSPPPYNDSSNVDFSADQTNGGTESWTLKASAHEPGLYQVLIWNNESTPVNVSITVTSEGTQYATMDTSINSGGWIIFINTPSVLKNISKTPFFVQPFNCARGD